MGILEIVPQGKRSGLIRRTVDTSFDVVQTLTFQSVGGTGPIATWIVFASMTVKLDTLALAIRS